MTISTEAIKSSVFAGNGSTTAFAFTFKTFAQGDLVVTLTSTSFVETVQTITTHYTVSLNSNQDSDPGGTVTMVTAPASGEKLVIANAPAYTQGVDLVSGGAFNANVIEDAIDRNTILARRAQELTSRSIQIPVSDDTGTTVALPTEDLRASKFLAFDSDGNVTVSTTTNTTVGTVDETDTDTTKDKLVSNNLARGWEAKIGITNSMTKGADIASASPLVLGTDGNYFDVTGTTGFTAMTVGANRFFILQFDGALTMTHHATNLDLPGEANITTAAGDVAMFLSTGANTVQCVGYVRADGTPITIKTLSESLNGADNEVSRINLKDYGEVTEAMGNLGATPTFNIANGNSKTGTVNANITSMSFSNWTASDEFCGMTLMLTNGGAFSITWDTAIDWAGGTAPTLTSSGVDCLIFWTVDGGTIINGAVVALDLQ